ncbi:MAG: hypothetical protein AAFV07_05110 [Bacteroidota bacterium]
MLAKHQEHIQLVAEGFGDRLKQVVFVGGGILDVYATDRAAPPARPTQDIDVIINVDALFDLFRWEPWLEQRGFLRSDPSQKPALNWTYKGVKVHLAPLNPEISGYSNRWFEEGVFHSRAHRLPNGTLIRIFTPAYFIAAKIEAFIHRGEGDFRSSEDFEDLVYLLDNRPEILDDLTKAFHEVRKYIQGHFARFLEHPDLEEGLMYALPFGADEGHFAKIREVMDSVANYEPAFA